MKRLVSCLLLTVLAMTPVLSSSCSVSPLTVSEQNACSQYASKIAQLSPKIKNSSIEQDVEYLQQMVDAAHSASTNASTELKGYLQTQASDLESVISDINSYSDPSVVSSDFDKLIKDSKPLEDHCSAKVRVIPLG